MKLGSLVVAPLLLTALGMPDARGAQQPASDGPIVLTFPTDVDPVTLDIHYQLRGVGGTHGVISGKAGVWEYAIDGTTGPRAFQTVKVIVYAGGRQFLAQDLGDHIRAGRQRVAMELLPLPTVPLLGRVVPPPIDAVTDVRVQARYYNWWRCEFFGLPDCGMSGVLVATAAIDPLGRFTIDLPDFTQDATVTSFNAHGEFEFEMRDGSTGNVLADLRAEGAGHPAGHVPIRREYPGELVFTPRRQ